MTTQTLQQFLMWCTILNGGLLIFSALLCTFAGGLIYRLHSKWFPMPRETFNGIIYAFVGVYKLIFITFNLIPYIALIIIG